MSISKARADLAADGKDMERTQAGDGHVLPGHAVVLQGRRRWLARDTAGIAALRLGGLAAALEADVAWRLGAGAWRGAALLATRRCAKVELLPIAQAGALVIDARDRLHVLKPLRGVAVVLAAAVCPLDRGGADLVGGMVDALALGGVGCPGCLL